MFTSDLIRMFTNGNKTGKSCASYSIKKEDVFKRTVMVRVTTQLRRIWWHEGQDGGYGKLRKM